MNVSDLFLQYITLKNSIKIILFTREKSVIFITLKKLLDSEFVVKKIIYSLR